MAKNYHIPVMLQQCIEGLNINPAGIYVDATFGGGGHAREILKHLTTGRLVAFDRDNDAIPAWADERLIFVNHNYKYLSNFLRYYELNQVDGILADLGISSHHIDIPERGFSFRFDAPLDMRMNQDQKMDAKQVVNEYSEEKLQQIFREYGELKQAYKIAKAIAKARENKQINTTFELVNVIKLLVPKKTENKFLAQVFQAIRIEVNGELEALKQFLTSSLKHLKKGGRLVIMSYHSLEDRLVKNFLRSGNFEGKEEVDLIYGNRKSAFKLINKKVIVPSDEEMEQNNRARSAKLRIAEKL